MSLKSGIITFLLMISTVVCESILAGTAVFTHAETNKSMGAFLCPDTVTNDSPQSITGINHSIAEGRLRILTDSLAAIIEGKKYSQGQAGLVVEIEAILSDSTISDTLLLSDAFYFTGIHYSQTNNSAKAINYFSISAKYREQLSLCDRRYSNGLSNLSASLFITGDYPKAYSEALKALEIRKKVSGPDSSVMVTNYLNLASICLELNDPDKATAFAEAGLEISRIFPDNVPAKPRADLLQVIGLSLYRRQEYNKSLVYCREALRIYETDKLNSVDSRILLYNTIAQVCRRLDQADEAEEYFRKGLAIKDGPMTRDKYLLYINYANFLAENGRIREGERVMNAGLDNVGITFGRESREYFTMLVSVAEFVNKSLGESDRSLDLYSQCFAYVRANPWDVSMTKYLTAKYVGALLDAGRYSDVLGLTGGMTMPADSESRELLPKRAGKEISVFSGGVSEDDLNMLEIRYKALNGLYDQTGNGELLGQAIETGRKIALVYDNQRLEMSEEESRTSLSSNSRDIYTGIIENYARLYETGHDRESLEGLFEFSERSKVAGFLASMRELNAARFSLPEELTGLEAGIKRQTGYYRELIANEKLRAAPDSQRLATWESATFRLLRSRDSLNRIFEEQYPSYYNLKYRNEVTPLSDVNSIVGRRANLLSYVLTGDRLYIFVVNRKRSEVIVRDIDQTFFDSLQEFRTMLSSRPVTTGSRAPFNEYMDLAFRLYSSLIEPAVPYLVGDKIVISPDNILSYIPFEALVTEEFRSPDLYYREVPFALKKFRFSYIYSATLSSESARVTRKFRNKLIAFAPSYEGMRLDDTLMAAWPGMKGELRGLPNAILEAEDAVNQCGGTAYLGGDAKESTFKNEARRYDIIHLAMHALVDDRRPAFSKMLFETGPAENDDGLLNTYEVYSLQLNAMMVVLTSCNTGAGMLVNGEGILSLARGFLYAGSRSAVMSMWEVEDSSAPDVIHSFYKNLRSGQTKSSALRTARLRFLETADQSRSHPYYWASLVIYGDDTPLWYNRVILYMALICMMLVAAALVAIVYRGPRS